MHHAIEGKLPSKIINWLIEHGADLHLEDNEGLDCCDKVARDNSYPKIKVLRDHQCKLNRRLRTKANKQDIDRVGLILDQGIRDRMHELKHHHHHHDEGPAKVCLTAET